MTVGPKIGLISGILRVTGENGGSAGIDDKAKGAFRSIRGPEGKAIDAFGSAE
jgi:hypothetical protein